MSAHIRIALKITREFGDGFASSDWWRIALVAQGSTIAALFSGVQVVRLRWHICWQTFDLDCNKLRRRSLFQRSEMQTTLSPDTIVALTSLQTRNTFDYSLKWTSEYAFIFCTPWRSSKLLYLIARYSPFFLLGFHLSLDLLPNESVRVSFQFVIACPSAYNLVGVRRHARFWRVFVQCLPRSPYYPLRVFSFYGRGPCGDAVQEFCVSSSAAVCRFSPLIFSLRLRSKRPPKVGKRFLVAFFSGINIVAIVLLKYNYATMFQDFQIVIHSILVTRMHLALWDREKIELDTPQIVEMVTLSQAEFASPTLIDQWT
ncbi:hypothetical protein BU15DRAFT_63019 [Melanogaster broomeanus]|nr:hypothetical protein BU15DRAFT_63019 [Melanogaster broomeanus]